MSVCVLLVKFNMITAGISISIYASLPAFIKDIIPSQDCWIPGNDPVARIIIYVVELIVHVEGLSLLSIFDGLYLLITANLKMQFKLLRTAIQTINLKTDDEEVYWIKFKKCCQYHKFLIRY